MARFNITFETVTPESAKHGEAANRGFIAEGVTLRDAFNALRFEGAAVEADASPCKRPRWLTFAPDHDYSEGAETQKSLHIPESVTDASARRIARIFGYQCA